MVAVTYSESHRLELDSFAVEVLISGDGEAEVILYRNGQSVFRAGTTELGFALAFVEKHGEFRLVQP